MIVEDSLEITAPPEVVFQFFDAIERHYLAWHPDHVEVRWERGHGVTRGNVVVFTERSAGKRLTKRVVFTRVVPNAQIAFAPTFWLMRLFLPRMVCRVVPDGGDCGGAHIELRTSPLAQRAHRSELAAVREHMRVEGRNLKRSVETSQAPASGGSGMEMIPSRRGEGHSIRQGCG